MNMVLFICEFVVKIWYLSKFSVFIHIAILHQITMIFKSEWICCSPNSSSSQAVDNVSNEVKSQLEDFKEVAEGDAKPKGKTTSQGAEKAPVLGIGQLSTVKLLPQRCSQSCPQLFSHSLKSSKHWLWSDCLSRLFQIWMQHLAGEGRNQCKGEIWLGVNFSLVPPISVPKRKPPSNQSWLLFQ